MELRGRVALVTGAGRRLGRELARALAGRGMTLAIHRHASSEGAEALRAEVSAAGGRAECFAADLTDAAAARALPARVVDAFGRLDVLVNSAAVMHRLDFEHTTPEQYDDILDLNLRSVFFCTQGAAAALRAARGKVVNIADLAGLQPWPGFAAHSVSKAGVIMLTKVMARSLAPEVTVNAIAPGAVLVPEE
jgi:pteridine reductase